MGYHAFKDDEGKEYGSFETYHLAPAPTRPGCVLDAPGHELAPGWYWWACFPGCLPDGEPTGPFETESAAIEDAQGQ
jgi:hypothetical protein